MYSNNNTKDLQKLTTELLKKKDNDKFSKKDVENLRSVLRFHEHRYYILNDPLVADFEYDQLFKSLEKIEAGAPRSTAYQQIIFVNKRDASSIKFGFNTIFDLF